MAIEDAAQESNLGSVLRGNLPGVSGRPEKTPAGRPSSTVGFFFIRGMKVVPAD